jgi:hypothetical protein
MTFSDKFKITDENETIDQDNSMDQHISNPYSQSTMYLRQDDNLTPNSITHNTTASTKFLMYHQVVIIKWRHPLLTEGSYGVSSLRPGTLRDQGKCT